MTEENKKYQDTREYPETLSKLRLREDSLSESTLK